MLILNFISITVLSKQTGKICTLFSYSFTTTCKRWRLLEWGTLRKGRNALYVEKLCMIVQLGIVTCVFIPVSRYSESTDIGKKWYNCKKNNLTINLNHTLYTIILEIFFLFFQVKNLIHASFVGDASGQITTSLAMKRNVPTDMRKILQTPKLMLTAAKLTSTIVSHLRRSC